MKPENEKAENERAVMEVVSAARLVQAALDGAVPRSVAPNTRATLRHALANLDRLTP